MPKTAKSKGIEDPPNIESSSEESESSGLKAAPTDEEIGQRAYEIFQARGGADGQAIDDWLQAERELRGINSDDQITSE